MHRMIAGLVGILLAGCGGETPPGTRTDDTNRLEMDGTAETSVSPTAEVLAGSLRDPGAVRVDDFHAYFLEANIDTDAVDIQKIAKSGGPTVVLVEDTPASDLEIDTTHVYWPEWPAGTVRSVSKLGGAPHTLAEGSGEDYPWDLEVGALYVYWTTEGSIRKVPKWGGWPATVTWVTYPTTLASDALHLYTFSGTALGGGTNRVYRVSKLGGFPIPLTGPQDDAAMNLTVSDGHLYWMTFWSGSFKRTSKDFGLLVSTLAEGIAGGWQPSLLDGDHIYYGNGNAIWMLPREGGEPVQVATGDDWGLIRGLATDATHIYATVAGEYGETPSGMLLKIEKPAPNDQQI